MITYAAAVPQDLPEIGELLRACDLPSADLSANRLGHFLTARAQERLLGCIGLEPLTRTAALLRSLAVAPERRGLGVASRLCDEIETHARAAGLDTLYLLTTTARGYFAARGYRPVDRDALPEAVRATAEHRELCPATAVAMKKDLGTAGVTA